MKDLVCELSFSACRHITWKLSIFKGAVLQHLNAFSTSCLVLACFCHRIQLAKVVLCDTNKQQRRQDGRGGGGGRGGKRREGEGREREYGRGKESGRVGKGRERVGGKGREGEGRGGEYGRGKGSGRGREGRVEGGRKENIVKECRRNKDKENERKGGRKWRVE